MKGHNTWISEVGQNGERPTRAPSGELQLPRSATVAHRRSTTDHQLPARIAHCPFACSSNAAVTIVSLPERMIVLRPLAAIRFQMELIWNAHSWRCDTCAPVSCATLAATVLAQRDGPCGASACRALFAGTRAEMSLQPAAPAVKLLAGERSYHSEKCRAAACRQSDLRNLFGRPTYIRGQYTSTYIRGTQCPQSTEGLLQFLLSLYWFFLIEPPTLVYMPWQ